MVDVPCADVMASFTQQPVLPQGHMHVMPVMCFDAGYVRIWCSFALDLRRCRRPGGTRKLLAHTATRPQVRQVLTMATATPEYKTEEALEMLTEAWEGCVPGGCNLCARCARPLGVSFSALVFTGLESFASRGCSFDRMSQLSCARLSTQFPGLRRRRSCTS